MRDIIKIIKTTGIYFMGNSLSKLILFLMIPVYTAFLSPQQYGFFDLTLAYIHFVVPVIFMEIWIAGIRFVFDYSELKDKYSVLSGNMVICFMAAAVYSLGFWAFTRFFPFPYDYLVYIYGLSQAAASYYGYAARGLGKNWIFAVSGIIAALANAVSCMVMLMHFKMGVPALYLAVIFGNAVSVIILECATKCLRNFSFAAFKSGLIKQQLLFGFGLSFSFIAYWFCTGYNRIVITSALGEAQNGVYAIAAKFAVVTLVGTCFAFAWQEMSYKKAAQQEGGAFFSNAFNLYLKCMACAFVLIIPVINIIFPFFVNKAFSASQYFVALYVFGTMLNMVTDFMGKIMTGIKKVRANVLTSAAGSLANVILVHALIKPLGLHGANIALICGFLLIFVLKNGLFKTPYAF